MCKSKGGYKRVHYDVQIKSFDTYLEMMVCSLCEQSADTHTHTVQSLFSQPETDAGGHHDMEIKGWMENGVL